MTVIGRARTVGALAAAVALVAAVAAAPGAARAPSEPDRPAVTAQNGIEQAVLVQINSARRSHGLRPLRLAVGLSRAAAGHAGSMARGGYFSHTSPDGTSPGSRIARHYRGSTVGETILWRSPGITADRAVAMWLASPLHRSLLLSSRFREIGLAAVHATTAPGVYHGLDVTILVADFGART